MSGEMRPRTLILASLFQLFKPRRFAFPFLNSRSLSPPRTETEKKILPIYIYIYTSQLTMALVQIKRE